MLFYVRLPSASSSTEAAPTAGAQAGAAAAAVDDTRAPAPGVVAADVAAAGGPAPPAPPSPIATRTQVATAAASPDSPLPPPPADGPGSARAPAAASAPPMIRRVRDGADGDSKLADVVGDDEGKHGEGKHAGDRDGDADAMRRDGERRHHPADGKRGARPDPVAGNGRSPAPTVDDTEMEAKWRESAADASPPLPPPPVATTPAGKSVASAVSEEDGLLSPVLIGRDARAVAEADASMVSEVSDESIAAAE
mmetsp:Transcript_15763/g.54755  ORF Transcript_15763/g.54755 Transcript_15763/m.54755 type:complete len:252 (+) Transcript_15763:2776-3531(+)